MINDVSLTTNIGPIISKIFLVSVRVSDLEGVGRICLKVIWKAQVLVTNIVMGCFQTSNGGGSTMSNKHSLQTFQISCR